MKNIEIKYRAGDPEVLQQRLKEAPDIQHIWTRRQTDIYYRVPSGRLKLRIEDDVKAHLIFYKRPDQPEARESNYHLAETDAPDAMAQLLELALSSWCRVEKTRSLFRFRNVRIHLDQVSGLGDFVEFESVVDEQTGETTARKNLDELQRLMSGYNLIPEPKSYSDLLATERGDTPE